MSALKPQKHLVLDEDVHRALKRRKTETGINVKDLGNCALRSVLERPLLVEVIGEQLVSQGRLTESEFDAIRRQAVEQLCASAADVDSLVEETDHRTLVAGSWEVRELIRDEAQAYQVLFSWVRDRRLRPMSLHHHEGDEFLIILRGAVLVSLDLESQVITAPGTLVVPGQAFHSVTPLDRDTQLLAVVSPPEPGFAMAPR